MSNFCQHSRIGLLCTECNPDDYPISNVRVLPDGPVAVAETISHVCFVDDTLCPDCGLGTAEPYEGYVQ